jgi:adenylate cyclase
VFEARLTCVKDGVALGAVSFAGRVTVGRSPARPSPGEPHLSVDDPIVSRRHCAIRQSAGGRFFLLDQSVNGTRVDGRRLLPGVEVELQEGCRIEIAGGYELVLEVGERRDEDLFEYLTQGDTYGVAPKPIEVTILVGDITGYTELNRRFAAADVALPVRRVFAAVEVVVEAFKGSLKEYQGDAIFAYWEVEEEHPARSAVLAGHCALALQERVAEVAADPAAWPFQSDFPLAMDWALVAGEVVVTTLGGRRPVALAMTGEVVNQAFRLEKLAGAKLGSILTSDAYRARVEDVLRLELVGRHVISGRDEEPVFALKGVADDGCTEDRQGLS